MTVHWEYNKALVPQKVFLEDINEKKRLDYCFTFRFMVLCRQKSKEPESNRACTAQTPVASVLVGESDAIL